MEYQNAPIEDRGQKIIESSFNLMKALLFAEAHGILEQANHRKPMYDWQIEGWV